MGELAKAGVEARALALYDSQPVAVDDPAALTACDAVLVHSARAAVELARILKACPSPGLRALGLSKAVLKPLARMPLGEKIFPSFPLEGALLNLIDRS